MRVDAALRHRKSTRAFTDQPVEDATVTRILDAARWAPSGTNTQPWQVAVVSGDCRNRLQNRILAAFDRGDRPGMDFHYYPTAWEEPFRSRQIACAKQLYGALDIKREDRQRRREQWVANYRAFDAPVMLIFFIDRHLETGSYIDFGMFLQSIMLMAASLGLATCPQASLGEYPDVVREELGYADRYIVVCGMALGYENESAPVNQYRTPRQPVESFTRFID